MKFDYVVLPVKNFQLTKTESKTRQPDDGHPADISLKNEKNTSAGLWVFHTGKLCFSRLTRKVYMVYPPPPRKILNTRLARKLLPFWCSIIAI